MSGRPVPWASWEEWSALRDDLWSSELPRQEAGFQQVCAWRLRGKLPLGVDATAHLMDVRRADAEWQRAVAWVAGTTADGPAADAAVAAGELPLRLRYSLPLIRLVNGISDSQQRGRVASSVAVLSDAAGLPRALVDVRHEATHNELPSLPLLRAAAESALTWLWENYWDGQSRALVVAAERISSLLTCLANSWRAATAAGLSGSASALAAAAAAAEEDDNEGGDTDGEATGGYSGSEGQRLRRQAMSELRSLVPPAFTHELLQPILECQVLLPPELPMAAVAAAPASGPAPPAPPLLAHREAAMQQQREKVDARTWRSTMKQLLKWYPRLRTLLLQAALRRLVAPAPSPPCAPTPAAPPRCPPSPRAAPPDSSSPSEQRARTYALWVLRLLPSSALVSEPTPTAQGSRLGSPSRKQSRPFGAPGSAAASKAAKKAAAAAARACSQGDPAGDEDGSGGGSDAILDGPLGCQQLQELLSIATSKAPVAEVAPAAAAGGGSVAAAREGTAGCRLRALEEVVAALHRALTQAGAAGRGGRKRPRALATTAPAATNDEPPSGGVGDGSDAVVGGEEGLRMGEGAAGIEEGGIEEHGRGYGSPVGGNSAAKRPCCPHEQQSLLGEGGPRDQPRRCRWQRCAEWSRCAIGCLPCPLNPNGRVPPLLAPPPMLQPPPQSRLQQPQPDAQDARHMGPLSTSNDAETAGRPQLGGVTAQLVGGAAGMTGDAPSRETRSQELDLYDEYGEYYIEPEPDANAVLATNGQAAGGNGGGCGAASDRGGCVGGVQVDGKVGAVTEEGEKDGLAQSAASSLFGALLQQEGASGSAIGFLL